MRAKSSRKTQRPLDHSSYEQLAEFRYVLRHFLIFSENAALAAGLSAQQHQALLAIKASREPTRMTAGVLAEQLGIQHHSAVGLLDRLQQKALVRRQKDAQDRRRVLIVLTAKAERLLAELSAAHHRELRRVAPVLRTLLNDLAHL